GNEVLGPGLGDDVEVPAGELCSQPHVLTAATDGQRQLIVGHDELHGVVALVDEDLGDLGWTDRAADETRRIVVIWHDVDLFSAKLLHHGLDTRPAHTDACTHRVDVRVAAVHCDLRTQPGFAGDAHDAHDALVDLGYFLLEELDDQPRVSAAEHNLR